VIDTIKNFICSNGYSPLELPRSDLNLIQILGCLEYICQQFPEDAPEVLFASILATDIQTISHFALAKLTSLARGGDQASIDKLYTLAIEFEHEDAIHTLRQFNIQPINLKYYLLFHLFFSEGYLAKDFNIQILSDVYLEADDNLKKRITISASKKGLDQWLRLVEAIYQIIQMKEPDIIEHYPSFTETEKKVFLNHLFTLADQSNILAQTLVWKLFIFHEDPVALEYAYANKCLPEDPAWLAVFYFLSNRWEEYQTIDYNHKLLGTIYQVSSRNFRLRLLHHSRVNGQIEWMAHISRSLNMIWLEDLTDTDWEYTIKYLLDMNNYSDLWRIVPYAPPIWGNHIINRLITEKWIPDKGGENESFLELSQISKECTASPLMMRPTKTYSLSFNPTCIQLDSINSKAAIGCETGHIFIYNLLDNDISNPITLSSPSKYIRAIAFDFTGEFLAASMNDSRIRIYRLKDGQIIKTLEGHTGAVRSLNITPDSKYLYSTSVDGSIRQWQFPFGSQAKILRQGESELLCATLSSTGDFLLAGGLKSDIELWNISSGSKIREINTRSSAVTAISSSNQGELFAMLGNDNSIQTWNYSSGSFVNKITNLPGKITHLDFHPTAPIIIASDQDGIIYFLNALKNSTLETFYATKSPGIGICTAESGKYFLTANQNGAIYYWDLEGFLLAHFPISYTIKFGLQYIIDRQQSKNISPIEKKWLSFISAVIKLRHQYDIQISDTSYIHAGNFDIQLL